MKAVVFDFYGTLAPGRSVVGQSIARRAQADALGIDPDVFDLELTATVDERFRGAGDDIEGSLRWLALRVGIEPGPEALRRAARIRLDAERSFGEPRPDAVGVLSDLRGRGLRIGVE